MKIQKADEGEVSLTAAACFLPDPNGTSSQEMTPVYSFPSACSTPTSRHLSHTREALDKSYTQLFLSSHRKASGSLCPQRNTEEPSVHCGSLINRLMMVMRKFPVRKATGERGAEAKGIAVRICSPAPTEPQPQLSRQGLLPLYRDPALEHGCY